MKAHQHYEILMQWIAGADIEFQSPTTDEWCPVPNVNELGQDDNYRKPNPLHPAYDYFTNWRVKWTSTP